MWRSKLPELKRALEAREKRTITHQEIADATGVRRPTITAWMDWEARFRRIDAAIIGALAEFFGVEPSDVVEWVYEEDPEVLGFASFTP